MWCGDGGAVGWGKGDCGAAAHLWNCAKTVTKIAIKAGRVVTDEHLFGQLKIATAMPERSPSALTNSVTDGMR